MRRCRPWLGTFVEIEADDVQAIEAGFAAIETVHNLMSAHDPLSELSRINRGERLRLSAETLAVLDRAQFWFDSSDGAFDPAAAGKAAIASGVLPIHPGQPLPACDLRFNALSLEDDMAELTGPACLDLGGIAKGYAVDAAIAVMIDAGAEHGFVNAGGDMAAFGEARSVDIVDPRTRFTNVRLDLADAALATSAGLQSDAGLDFDHLLGRNHAFVSVTVVAPRAIDADALTKIAFCDHPRLCVLLELAGARALGMVADGRVVELGLAEAA